jgi:putative membrane protein
MNDEGISRITKLLNEDLGSLSDRLKKAVDAGRSYTSFGGALNHENSSVKFIYRTDTVK